MDKAGRCLWFLASLILIFLVFWDGPSFLNALIPATSAPRDFFQEWASARNVWHGLPVYSPHAQTIPLYLGMPARPGYHFVTVNAHPPVSVLLGLPLSGFDYRIAHAIWNLISLGALLASVAIIAGTLGVACQLRTWVLVAFLVLSGPLHTQLLYGQLNLVLLLLVTGVWWADRSGRPGWAGTLLGLATAIKFLPGLLFLYFALRRQWYALIAGIVAILVSGVLGIAVLGPEAFRAYRDSALPELYEWRAARLNCSIPGLCYKLFNPGTKGNPVVPIVQAPTVASCLSAVGAVAILGAVALSTIRARSRSDCDLAFGLAVVGMLLVSPVTWDHYFLLLLLPLALLWQRLPRTGPSRWVLLAAVTLLWLPDWRIYRVSGWLFGIPSEVASPLQTVTVLSLPFYALLGVFGLALFLAMRKAGGIPSAEPTAIAHRRLRQLSAGGNASCPGLQPTG